MLLYIITLFIITHAIIVRKMYIHFSYNYSMCNNEDIIIRSNTYSILFFQLLQQRKQIFYYDIFINSGIKRSVFKK